jgi:hypothetical protein
VIPDFEFRFKICKEHFHTDSRFSHFHTDFLIGTKLTESRFVIRKSEIRKRNPESHIRGDQLYVRIMSGLFCAILMVRPWPRAMGSRRRLWWATTGVNYSDLRTPELMQ